MENQHKQITGYRDLTQEEIDLMNRIKALGPQVQELIQDLDKHQDTDKRAIAIGRTELQTGLMWLIRSVARPTTFA
jgi:hypothetical protein